MKISEVEKAALAWALQRRRYHRAESLGKASARAALWDKAERLSDLALALGCKAKAQGGQEDGK